METLHPFAKGLPGDPWLDRWWPTIARHAAGRPVFELGCGGGRDSERIAARGHQVIGIDHLPAAIEQARARVPTGHFHCQDIRDIFPTNHASIGVAIASLSLHYFPWEDTENLVHRLGEALVPGGMLFCRLNSTRDIHYGAVGHPQLQENFYNVGGEPKRFFDGESLDKLFRANWREMSREEWEIDRYDLPKFVWEVVLEWKPGSTR